MASKRKKVGRGAAKDAVAGVLARGGEHLGDIAWFDGGGVRELRWRLRDNLAAADLPRSLAPDDPDPRAALGKAVSAHRERGRGVFLRRAERRGEEVLVVVQDGDDFDVAARVSVDATGDLAVAKEPGVNGRVDEVLSEIRSEFREHLDNASTQEVSSMVVDAILGWCGGIRLKERGHVYWVPAAGRDELRALKGVVDDLGSSHLTVLPVHDSDEAKDGLRRAARASFEQQLNDVAEELEAFASRDNVRASTLQRRLEEFQDLRDKVELYSDVLDKQKGRLLGRLEEARRRAVDLLSEIDGDDAASAA